MRCLNRIVAAALLSTGAPAGAQNVYECRPKHGPPTYQETPCPPGQTADTYTIDKPSRPMAPTPEQWKETVASYLQGHPDIQNGNNTAIMQRQLNLLATSGLSSWDMLDRAYSAAVEDPGWTPDQVLVDEPSASDASDQEAVGGIGSSAYQRGEITGTRCTAPDGTVYYADGGCRVRAVPARILPRDWHKDTVRDMPGAMMVGPNEAVNPETGEVVQLQSQPVVAPAYVHQRDAGQAVNADAACTGAMAYEKKHPFSRSAEKAKERLCDEGRSLYDQQSSAGSLYSDDDQ